jgi:hypothetical protein
MVGNMYALKIVRHRDKHKGRQMLKRHAIRVLLCDFQQYDMASPFTLRQSDEK